MLSLLSTKGDEEAHPGATVDLARLESGPGGVYLIPYQSKPVAYVVSAAGTVDHQFPLAAPQGFTPSSTRVSATQILVEFVKQPETGNAEFRYMVYNAQNGAPVYEYKLTDKPGIFACYDWTGNFTFLGTLADRRVIQFARVE